VDESGWPYSGITTIDMQELCTRGVLVWQNLIYRRISELIDIATEEKQNKCKFLRSLGKI